MQACGYLCMQFWVHIRMRRGYVRIHDACMHAQHMQASLAQLEEVLGGVGAFIHQQIDDNVALAALSGGRPCM